MEITKINLNLFFLLWFVFSVYLLIRYRKQIMNLKAEINERPQYVPQKDIVFNVHNFNRWFVNKDNNAVYANKGIYLRTDKLSEAHIEDYLEKAFNIKNPAFLWKDDLSHRLISDFHNTIRNNWIQQINNQNKK